MSSSLGFRGGLLFAALLGATGCGEDRYTVRLAPEAALEGAAAYDLVLLWVTCQHLVDAGGIAERGWVARRSQWAAGAAAPDLGEVEPGRYALVGIVRGSDCGAVWAGCRDIELERGGGETLEVTLQPIGGFGCLPRETCAGGGICVEEPQCDNATIPCDNDGDGFVLCLEGHFPPECDCHDEDISSYPGAEEHCDGYDNDCNGEDDPIECAGCFDRCEEPDACHRPDCPDGPEGDCVLVDRLNGAECVGEGGPALCCNGVCDGACVPEAEESEACGDCGTRTRVCGPDCQWEAWGACDESGAVCTPRATRSNQPCGNCGTGNQICNDSCQWELDGACNDEGVCSPGATRPATCPECGVGEDTCQPDCTWRAGPCEPDPGDTCVDPEVCCPNGLCGEDGAECCGTDVSTCGPAPLCTDWACDLGACTEVDETAGTDPEDECAAECCDGAGACASC